MVVDNSLRQKIVRYLKHLGLDTEQALVYIYLLEHGPSSVLTISKGLKTGRTKLYPLLEDAATKQLIVVHEKHYGTTYEAQPPQVLDFLVSEHERKAEGLRSGLSTIVHALSTIQSNSPSESRIVEYRGVDGLKQMNFNLTKAQEEFRVLELAGLDKHLGKHFADNMRSLYQQNNLQSYDLTNNSNRASEPGIEVSKAQARYIEPAVFKIEFETYIYNNCVGLINYDTSDIFGVEIYNAKLASQQKQFFDLIWQQAQPLK